MPRHQPLSPYLVMLRDAERQIVRGAVDASDGNHSGAATMLGVSLRFLRKRAAIIGGFLGHDVYEPPRTPWKDQSP